MSLLKQASELAITIKLKRTGDVLTKIDKVRRKFRLMFRDIRRDFRRIKRVMTGFMGQVAALGLAVGAVGLGKSFINTAASIEMMEVRLGVLLRSTHQATIMFKNLFNFAMKVPFALKNVMEGSVRLAAVMDGGRAQVEAWLPLVADLAGSVGMTFEDTAEQIMRMYGAGAAAAVRFRKRGVLAMLGFKAGVAYTAEETRKTLVDMWKSPLSKFAGGAEKMKKTWIGMMSMLDDAWLKFQKRVMESGMFGYTKTILQSLTDWVKEWSKDSSSIMEVMLGIVQAISYIRQGLHHATQGWKLFKLGGVNAAEFTLKAFGMMYRRASNNFKDMYEKIGDFLPESARKTIQGIGIGMGLLALRMEIGGRAAEKSGGKIAKAIEKADKEVVQLRGDTELLVQKFKLINQAVSRQEKIDELTNKFIDLRVAVLKLKEAGDGEGLGNVTLQLIKMGKKLRDLVGIHAFKKIAINARALADEIMEVRDNTELMLGKSKEVEVDWDKIKEILGKAGVAAKIINDEIEKMKKGSKKTLTAWDGLKATFRTLGQTLENEVLSVIDQIYNRTKTTKEILADVVKSLARAATRQAVSAVFSAVGTAFGAAEGGIFNTGGMPVRAFAGGGVSGGGVTNGPEVIIRGERNHGRDPEAYVPLSRNRKIPVEIHGGAGGGGDTFNITMNVQAMDGQSFKQFINNPSQLKTLAGAAAQNAKNGR